MSGGREGGGGGIVISAGPEGCSSSSWLGLNTPRLVETVKQFTQLRQRFLNLFVVGPPPSPPPPPPPPRPLDINHVMNNTRPSLFFAGPLFRIRLRKLKNKKKGVGLGTRLVTMHVQSWTRPASCSFVLLFFAINSGGSRPFCTCSYSSTRVCTLYLQLQL